MTSTKWLSKIFAKSEIPESVTAYEIMTDAANFCINACQDNTRKNEISEFIKIINLLYTEGYAYTKHCIKNEFISNFIKNSLPLLLKEYLNEMPSPLKEEFIKTLIKL